MMIKRLEREVDERNATSNKWNCRKDECDCDGVLGYVCVVMRRKTCYTTNISNKEEVNKLRPSYYKYH